MFHVCLAHCMLEKIHKMSKCENSCLFVWSTVVIPVLLLFIPSLYSIFFNLNNVLFTCLLFFSAHFCLGPSTKVYKVLW